MAKPISNLVTAIDLGSAKVCVMVAEITPDGLRYRGRGIADSRGTRKGVIIDIKKAVECVKKAVEEAETEIDAPIERAVVGIAGPHTRGVNSQGGITLSSRAREITRDDVRQAVEKAKGIPLPDDRQPLHLLPQEYIVDEQSGILDPLGMVGKTLAVRIHIATASLSATQNVVMALSKAGVFVDDTVFEPLAAADAVLRADERELGVCLVDIGAGSTDLIVFHEGAVQHTGVVPIGGDHFTNDVAVGLRTPLNEAEKLKKQFGCAVVTRIPEGNEIEVPSVGDKPSRLLPQRLLGEILEPRARELFEMTRDHLRHAGVIELCDAGFVLTGGGARLTGLCDIVDQITRKQARIGGSGALARMPADLLAPEYSTALGLLLYEFRSRVARGPQDGGFSFKLKKIFSWKD